MLKDDFNGLVSRPRRNRKNQSVRAMIRENNLSACDLIAPLFIKDGDGDRDEITSMPGHFRHTFDSLIKEVELLSTLGVEMIALFPVVDESLKDSHATYSYNPENFYLRAISEIKEKFPNIQVMTDVAMDPYSSDGHDGLVDPISGEIKNDETLEILAKMAIAQAAAGADFIGPSDMMDGRVSFLRQSLDRKGFKKTSIISYTAKYASAFYGPFRDALDSAPKKGDKKTYQMDPANKREAIRECLLDEREGADVLMVKPGLCYLDVLSELRRETHLPLAVYNVSGEYAMLLAAAEKGWLDLDQAMLEVLISFKRAGADMILSYFTSRAAKLLKDQ